MNPQAYSPEIRVEPRFGYRYLDPPPSTDVLRQYYEQDYFELLDAGGRAPDIRKLMAGGKVAAAELEWLKSTLWPDVVEYLTQEVGPGRWSLLDYGCGTGHFVDYCRQLGIAAHGLELSIQARKFAKDRLNLEIYDQLDKVQEVAPVDAVVLLNVLEHTVAPLDVLHGVSAVLRPGGALGVIVPNDFNFLQERAASLLKLDPWWIAIPDHPVYFDFDSLRRVVEHAGYRVSHMSATFPMELFLLMGDDYVRDPEMGRVFHGKRVLLETSMGDDERRRLNTSFASAGIGRQILMVAVKNE